ncbi:MAG: ketose-bisphosphate aldolase [Firmicutes bacterium]|nr:ketose-bisphosphate aldolase [Bacillota bacterium]
MLKLERLGEIAIMLANMKYVLTQAQKEHYAVPHFNVWNVEMLEGVMDAVEEAKSPVIISFGSGFLGNTEFDHYAKMMVGMAATSTMPVVLHWDHGRNIDVVTHAWQCGMNSLMIDNSAQNFEVNIKLTKEVVDKFHPMGIPIEAELGHVGAETVYEEALANYGYTDPSQAAEFVERTNIDSLAVAIGNQHGVYSSEPQINLEILEKVRDTVSIPLVLHGASGIGDEDIKKCIARGITKINIHTELCQAAMSAIVINQKEPFLKLQQEVRKAVAKRAMEKIKLFGSYGKARN